MKILNLTLENISTKRYLNIAHAIKESIKRGNVSEKEKLPSTRVLAEQLSVNRHTIMAAYNELVAQGWLETHERQGYTVANILPIYKCSQSLSTEGAQILQHKWRVVKGSNSMSQVPATSYTFNFAGGNPDIALFPFNEFKGFMTAALNRPAFKELNYGENTGYPPFIEEVSTYLRRVRSITNKEIIVVNGTQEALYILSQLLITQGDKVAVESLGYRPAWNALENAGAELIGIKQTNEGIDVEHLEQVFKDHTIRLLYLTPLHQYPTTTTLPAKQRKLIYQLAQQHNVAIIEDDYDHEFHYTSQPLAPMAATDPSGLIIYLSSFSKILFPGARLGIIAVDKTLVRHIINYRTAMNHKVNVLQQDAISRWMKEGAFERHLRKATRIYQKRRQCMIDELNVWIAEGVHLEFATPPGGMALWVNIHKNAAQVAERAKNHSIYLLAEPAFHLEPKNNQNKYIRLGFAGQNELKIKQGLQILKSIILELNAQS